MSSAVNGAQDRLSGIFVPGSGDSGICMHAALVQSYEIGTT
ncbi:MAG TPA: hypothetical protein VII66_10880 [Gemmatimonadaceae bacterium]